ncbi:MAG: murein biosynthesis integral membrane protein MurJ [Rhodospirillales bacterium]|nr:murein biosynthesis integral membrane protein MurJ [Rhodospirillales bacterium]
MALLRSIATVGGFTMASRVLGFIRDMLIAAILGAGPVADAFLVAFKLPNLFRSLFAEGTFSAAFLPLFASTLEAEGRERAHAFANEAFAVLLLALAVFVGAAEFAMPYVMMLFAPGFLAVPEKFALTVELTRITFPYILFISLVAMVSGVLNSLGRFASAAAVPIGLNISLIAALLVFRNVMPTPGHAVAWGVFAAGILQFLWIYTASGRAGVWLRPARPSLSPRIRLLFRRIVPVALGAGAYQVNLAINMIIASFLPSGSIAYLFYADRLNQLPLGVIGIAVGTALLPLLTRQLRAGRLAEAAHSQNRAIELSLFLTLPAATALAVIAEPLVRVLFERGAFSARETAATAAAVAVYALGLPASALARALTPGFFAREDTSTPVKISVAAMASNVVFGILLMGPFLHVGIALATTLSAWLSSAALALVLRRRGHLEIDSRLARRIPRTILACAGMAVVLWLLATVLESPLRGALIERASALAALIGSGLLSYALLVQLLGAAKLQDLKGLLRRPAAGERAPGA